MFPRLTTFLLLLVCLWIGLPVAYGNEAVPVDARLKAGFLYNFFSFVQWPTPIQDDVVLGIVSTPAEAEVIEAVVAGKEVKGSHQLYVISGTQFADVAQADLVFVAATDAKTILHLIDQAAQLPVLLVGEKAAFVEAGGHMAIVRHGNKLELLVNLAQAEKKGFKISSKLLRLASRIVTAGAGSAHE